MFSFCYWLSEASDFLFESSSDDDAPSDSSYSPDSDDAAKQAMV